MLPHAAVVLVVALAVGVTPGRAGADAVGAARGQRHFEDVSGDLPNEPITAVAVDPANGDVLFAGLDGFVFRSTDAGEAWRPVLSFPRGIALDDSDADLADETFAAVDGALVFGREQVAGVRGDAGDTEDNGEDDDDDDDGDDEDDDDGDDDDDDRNENEDEDDDDDDGSGDDDDDEEDDDNDTQLDATALSRAASGVRALVFALGAAHVLYVATPRGLYRSLNRGRSFSRVDVPGGVRANDIRDLVVDPSRPGRLYVATAGGLLISRDGGASFARANGTVGTAACIAVAAHQLAPTAFAAERSAAAARAERVEAAERSVAVLLGTERGLWRSTDGGDSFFQVLLGGLPSFHPVASVAIAQSSETFYAGTSEGLFAGERDAALFERFAGVPTTLVQAIAPDPRRPRALVVGTRTRGVVFSSDGGVTIEEGAEQVPAAEVLSLARPGDDGANDDIVIATDRGVFRSRAGSGVNINVSGLKKTRAKWAQEAGLDETARTALEYHGLAHVNLHGMRERAGLSHLLPRATARFIVRVGQSTEADLFIILDGDEVPPGLDPVVDDIAQFGNVGAFVIEPADGLRALFFVQLVWDLDKLIFNRDEMAVTSRAGAAWYAAKRRVIERVRELWSARRRLMTELTFGDAPRGDDAARTDAQRRLRLEELTARLDADTGGVFSAGARSAKNWQSQEDSK